MNGLQRKQVSISEPDAAFNSYPLVKEGDPVPFGVAGLDKNGNDAYWVIIWSIPPNGKREYIIELVEGVKLTESSKLKAKISVANFDYSSTTYVSGFPDSIRTQFVNKGEAFNEIILTWKGGIPKHIMYNPFERGGKYLAEKQYDLAIKEFDKALEIKPDFYPAYYDRGSAHSGKGNYDLAIADFDSVLKLSPKFYPAYYMRGVAYKLKGGEARAVSDFREVLKLSNHPEVLQNTRKHLQELGQ
jgi:tetratricopeptide (TPR) repeat protein